MIPESALLCLELPSSALMAEAVQPLTDVAKQYLVASEDAVYDFVLKWARARYHKNWRSDMKSLAVLEAPFFKAEAPHRQRSLAAEDTALIYRCFVERAYKYRSVKVVEF
ncbi:BTB/POZ domain-containing protein POB1 [Vitis vinifera]|uniref:BTB/POZ domain-containing protein POB1 n=1 Tax=Vitis vinifera TaxID=29760 RepID=A0A438ECA5_VITVI|nr:BTB/POZ domain-containing protein POB1 [Vitis vinifera]